MNKPASLQDAVVKGLITQAQADEFRRLVESGDIIGLLLNTEMTTADLQDKLSGVAVSIQEALEQFTDYETLKTCLEFILKELLNEEIEEASIII